MFLWFDDLARHVRRNGNNRTSCYGRLGRHHCSALHLHGWSRFVGHNRFGTYRITCIPRWYRFVRGIRRRWRTQRDRINRRSRRGRCVTRARTWIRIQHGKVWFSRTYTLSHTHSNLESGAVRVLIMKRMKTANFFLSLLNAFGRCIFSRRYLIYIRLYFASFKN